jgi:predicted amidophosphoribosyltransferase
VKKRPQYAAAKAGDADAAELLVEHFANRGRLPELADLVRGRDVRLLPVHALESEGVNEIPAALAELLSEWLGLRVTESVVQSNTVGHTGASGFQRLANQAFFAGEVERGHHYLLVDDFIGQGGTLANLIGYIDRAGGHAVGATVLTGKPYSAKLPRTMH